MRVFDRYRPLLIAKHVSRLFSGRICIKGLGDFEFDQGVIQPSSESPPTIAHYQTAKAINLEIKKLKSINSKP